MSNVLAVLVDDAVQLEFDRGATVPAHQLAFLDNMDAKMDKGIVLDGESLADPDIVSRVKFVAQNMATALGSGNDKVAVAMCTYLGVRRPELKQVKISPSELGMTVDLDYENAYEKPVPASQPVTFHPTKH